MRRVPGSPEPLTENAHNQASSPNFAWQTFPPGAAWALSLMRNQRWLCPGSQYGQGLKN